MLLLCWIICLDLLLIVFAFSFFYWIVFCEYMSGACVSVCVLVYVCKLQEFLIIVGEVFTKSVQPRNCFNFSQSQHCLKYNQSYLLSLPQSTMKETEQPGMQCAFLEVSFSFSLSFFWGGGIYLFILESKQKQGSFNAFPELCNKKQGEKLLELGHMHPSKFHQDIISIQYISYLKRTIYTF